MEALFIWGIGLMSKFIIGIDPDLDKSGVAVALKGQVIKLWCLSLPELYNYFRSEKTMIKKVYLEAGWLNKKTSWHESKNKSTAEKTAYNVGLNHATGRLIEDMLKHLDIKYDLVRPTQSKRDHKDFCVIAKWDKAIPTNQEKRDAAMLITGIF